MGKGLLFLEESINALQPPMWELVSLHTSDPFKIGQRCFVIVAGGEIDGFEKESQLLRGEGPVD